METQRKQVGRGAIRYCWKLAEELDNLSAQIRYANKPSDLTYPMTNVRLLIRRLDIYRDQWLLEWLDENPETLKRWPKLWERYL